MGNISFSEMIVQKFSIIFRLIPSVGAENNREKACYGCMVGESFNLYFNVQTDFIP